MDELAWRPDPTRRVEEMLDACLERRRAPTRRKQGDACAADRVFRAEALHNEAAAIVGDAEVVDRHLPRHGHTTLRATPRTLRCDLHARISYHAREDVRTSPSWLTVVRINGRPAATHPSKMARGRSCPKLGRAQPELAYFTPTLEDGAAPQSVQSRPVFRRHLPRLEVRAKQGRIRANCRRLDQPRVICRQARSNVARVEPSTGRVWPQSRSAPSTTAPRHTSPVATASSHAPHRE